MAKKTYVTCDKRGKDLYFRVGKALLRVEFDELGEYSTDTEIIQKAIENSPLYQKEVQLKTLQL